MKLFISILMILTVLPGVCISAFSEESEPQDLQAPVSAGSSLYSYDEKDPPEIFFFPKEKARWDGSMVTMSEWYTLTELQKEKFLSEYLKQLQDQYKTSIEIMGMDYLKALNAFSSYSNDRTLREPSTKFIDILLSGQGKLNVKDQPREAPQK